MNLIDQKDFLQIEECRKETNLNKIKVSMIKFVIDQLIIDNNPSFKNIIKSLSIANYYSLMRNDSRDNRDLIQIDRKKLSNSEKGLIKSYFRKYIQERLEVCQIVIKSDQIMEYTKMLNDNLAVNVETQKNYITQIASLDEKIAQVVDSLSSNMFKLKELLRQSLPGIDKYEVTRLLTTIESYVAKSKELLASSREIVYCKKPNVYAHLVDKLMSLEESKRKKLSEIDELRDKLSKYEKASSEKYMEILKKYTNILREIRNREWSAEIFNL